MTGVEIGKEVPDFTLPASTGEQVSLRDYRGKRVILYFYPKDNTPTCTQQSCGFRDVYPQVEAQGAVVIGISGDDVKSHQKFVAKFELPFVLLADTEHEVCALYGVWKLKKMYGREYMGIERSTFLIDEQGVLVEEWRAVRLKGHIDQVLERLGAL